VIEIGVSESVQLLDHPDALAEVLDELRAQGFKATTTNRAHLQESIIHSNWWEIQLWAMGEGITVALAVQAVNAVSRRIWKRRQDGKGEAPNTVTLYGPNGDVLAHVPVPPPDAEPS